MSQTLHFISQALFICFLAIFSVTLCLVFDSDEEFSIIDFGSEFLHGDYTPPSPPPPSQPPHPPSLLCEDDLKGFGSLNTICELNSSLIFTDDVYIEGNGNLYILPGVSLSCPVLGCSIAVNMSREFSLGSNAVIIAGSISVNAYNSSLLGGSVINVTGLAGEPPAQTSGTPSGVQGAGGGHGGRGASCVKDNSKLPDDVWGGDAYSWSSLDKPWSYGSKGSGTASKEGKYGGGGGGRILLDVVNSIAFGGSLLADGGDGGVKGGGGSGGSIYIKTHRTTGTGSVSAVGGNGFAGGGGGRISYNVFSRHDSTEFFVHGGKSFGCPENSGAAGTYYDAVPRSLIVNNNNMSTQTDTLLLEFPKQPLWTNIYIQNHAKALFPLFWSRVQVQGQIHLSSGAILSFGLAHYGSSVFELMAEELLMSDSVFKIFGALRMSVKMHLMWNSQMVIDGTGDAIVATSVLEASNLVVLKESSVIHSNANLGVHGQGFLNLTGAGNLIEAQRLIISLFYNVYVGSGSVLRGPLDDSNAIDLKPPLRCEHSDCPVELLHPPEDCNVNSTLSFTLQICRVEDVTVEGVMTGSVVHFHWVRSVFVHSSGSITASGLGCTSGVGRGKYFANGFGGGGGGGGHGGKGGDGYYNGSFIDGGTVYGDPELPCELGSGSGNESIGGATAGGGIIVIGSLEHSLSSLFLDGSLRADGETFGHGIHDVGPTLDAGTGGGSGGTILLFLQSLVLGDSSVISSAGGHGNSNGGGGGGGRVHFHWADIPVGDAYSPIARVKGSINTGGGFGRGHGCDGKNGTITGKSCPVGLYGIFCEECPVGTFKNVTGSNKEFCLKCPSHELPNRAIYLTIRGGVTEIPCPYKCISERYHMPHCYTALEELVYAFGGPWIFCLILFVLLILLALVLSVARMKFAGGDELPSLKPDRHSSRIDNSFPFLESLNEVLETNRIEESQSHVHRMYFKGSNTFSEPWHLPRSPPEQIAAIIYEDAFKKFVDEINDLATYKWWEGLVYRILCVFAVPLAWSWLQRCRKKKLRCLREFVRSEYDHSCLRSCRSRALYEGLKVTATSDLMLAYVDFFLGGDEKRTDLPLSLSQRLPMSLVFGGDGSYIAPFVLYSDNILTSLIGQSIPPTIWYRLVTGLNAQLRLVRRGRLKSTFCNIIGWLETHANFALSTYGVRVDLAWFQPTATGYCQFGLLLSVFEKHESLPPLIEGSDLPLLPEKQFRSQVRMKNFPLDQSRPEKIDGGILHSKTLRTLKENRAWCYPFSFIIYNTKPVGHQDLVGLFISIILLGDFSLVLLTLLQMFSISLLDFLLVLFILPLGLLPPFPAGIKALFSHGPRRSGSLARVYGLWNVSSLINVLIAFVCGLVHYMVHSSKKHTNFQSWTFSVDESEWWMLPCGLLFCKVVQARLIDYHIANLEVQDHTLYSNDPDVFWQS